MAKRSKKNSVELKPEDQHLTLVPNNQSHSFFWNSTLFSDVYLQNDVPVVYDSMWNRDDADFEIFLEQFRNFSEDFEGEKPHTWSERTTIDRAIKPILRMLGWTTSGKSPVDPWLEDESFSFEEPSGKRTYKPDFIIVDSHKELKYIQEKKGQAKIEEARRQSNSVGGVILTVEAKYWDRIEDLRQNKVEDKKRADKTDKLESSKGLDFDEQCLKYMEMLQNPYGILTDGKTWRLYALSASTPSHKPYFQFNIGHMIRHVNNSDFLKSEFNPDYNEFREQMKYFYFIFRKQSLHSLNNEKLFVDELLDYSKKYVAKVEEDLKLRFVNAMSIACNGFYRAAKGNKIDISIEAIRNIAESHIFNILFLKYCEARNILPIKQDPEGYRTISISNMLDKLDGFRPEKENDGLNFPLLRARFSEFKYSPSNNELYSRLLRLTTIVQNGNRDEFKGFAIKGFKSSIFSKQEWKLAQVLKLGNQEMVRILFELGYATADIPGKTYQQIPYNVFTPRQLGSIYESFLEFRLEKATEDMAYVKSQWSAANLDSNKLRGMDIPKVRKGELFFSPDNTERKATGSYYTPDFVVQFMVKETLDPLLKNKDSLAISKLKVCDPAMGSGHFLSATLNYIAKRYLEKLSDETLDDVEMSFTMAKQKVLRNCIYGADINPRAVKLAKMSLWLESADSSQELEELEDQIKCGNSLLSQDIDGHTGLNWEKAFFKPGSFKGFDAVIGNPPYIGERKNKHVFEPVQKSSFAKYYLGRMDYLYFFFHLSLDIVKEGGTIGMITTNYFLTADGAKKLRADIKTRSSVLSLINFNELKVFDSAGGQHNIITILQKGNDAKVSAKASMSGGSGTLTLEHAQNIFGKTDLNTEYFNIPQKQLWESEENYLRISGSVHFSGNKVQGVLAKMVNTQRKVNLGDICNTWIGIESSSDKTYVVPNHEIAGIIKKKEERSFFKPWFKNSDVHQYYCELDNHQSVIYTHENNLEEIKKAKGIWSYLKENEKTLKGRKGANLRGAFKRGNWWVLNTPRLDMDFEGEKIMTPYRTKTPRFSFNNTSWYASRDVYFITKKDSSFSLKYILGLLNSNLYFLWLYTKGKRKGEMMEMYSQPLSEIPVQKLSEIEQRRYVEKVEAIESLLADGIESLDASKNKRLTALKQEINKMVYKLYGLTTEEIEIVEQFVASKISDIWNEPMPASNRRAS